MAIRQSWSLAFTLCLIACAGLSAQEIKFEDVTKAAGIYEPLAGIMGHGGAWGDIDNDGLPDLYVGGFCDRPNSEYAPAAAPVPNRLFRNLGKGKFEQLRQPAVEFFGRTSGAVMADLDNNGTLEIYSANNAKGPGRGLAEPQAGARTLASKLLKNDSGKFTDISAESGACPEVLKTARNIGVFDYDGDSLLDLFVVEDRFTKNPRSVLLHNLGGLKFEIANDAAGIPNDIFGLGLAVADLNEDGRPDFFVGHSNRLFLSDGNGKYVESAELNKTFAWAPLNGEDWPCGAAFGDLNRDGRLDLVLSIHHEQARNRIYLNQGLAGGVPKFTDISREAGLPERVATKSPHVEVQDFDNDGWPDIYLSSAWLDDEGNVTPLLYRNLGMKDGMPRFASPADPNGKLVYYPAGPSADYDRDGRLDLFLINWFQGNHSRLMRNVSAERNWLDVQVAGKKMNRMGIGAVVYVYEPGFADLPKALLGKQEVTTGYGYASGQPALCHFGLDQRKTVDVVVRIPGGAKVTKRDVAANQRLVITEGE